jgi:hypothetical protein
VFCLGNCWSISKSRADRCVVRLFAHCTPTPCHLDDASSGRCDFDDAPKTVRAIKNIETIVSFATHASLRRYRATHRVVFVSHQLDSTNVTSEELNLRHLQIGNRLIADGDFANVGVEA